MRGWARVQPPASKLMLLSNGLIFPGSLPPAQRLWVRTQKVRLLALQRLRDESEARKVRVAAVALRVLLDPDLAALILPALHHRVAALGRVCHSLRSAADAEPELIHRLSKDELMTCYMCQRRLCRLDIWATCWALSVGPQHLDPICKGCMLDLNCNDWKNRRRTVS